MDSLRSAKFPATGQGRCRRRSPPVSARRALHAAAEATANQVDSGARESRSNLRGHALALRARLTIADHTYDGAALLLVLGRLSARRRGARAFPGAIVIAGHAANMGITNWARDQFFM